MSSPQQNMQHYDFIASLIILFISVVAFIKSLEKIIVRINFKRNQVNCENIWSWSLESFLGDFFGGKFLMDNFWWKIVCKEWLIFSKSRKFWYFEYSEERGTQNEYAHFTPVCPVQVFPKQPFFWPDRSQLYPCMGTWPSLCTSSLVRNQWHPMESHPCEHNPLKLLKIKKYHWWIKSYASWIIVSPYLQRAKSDDLQIVVSMSSGCEWVWDGEGASRKIWDICSIFASLWTLSQSDTFP